MSFDPLEDGKSLVELVDHMGDDSSVVRSARVSFQGDKTRWDRERDPKLIRFLLENGHTCYDDKTEVLTKAGWKNWPNVHEEDELAAIELNTWDIHFEKPMRLIQNEYSGPMYHLETQSIDTMVTPNHRQVVSRRTSRGGKSTRTPYYFEKSIFSSGNQRFYRKSGNLAHRQEVYNPFGIDPITFAKLVGFFVGDGHTEKTSRNQIAFHIKKKRKIDFILNIGLSVRKRAGGVFVIEVPEITKWFRENCYGDNGDKKLPDDFLEATREEASALLEGLKNSDGSTKRRTFVYDTSSKILFDQLQHLSSVNGFVFSGSGALNKTGVYRINHSNRLEPESKVKARLASSQKKEGFVAYSGKIYCAEVSTGALLVRRNGKTLVSGNSPFEHCQITFHISCPVFVARQWHRHRTWSFNEVSRRYTSENIEFYYPEEWRKQSESNRQASSGVFGERTMDAITEEYEAVVTEVLYYYESWTEMGMAREQARMILPQSMYTRFYGSVNLHNLMHFCDLRDKDDAQWEIRVYAQAMAKIAESLFPVTWGIYKELRS